MPFTLLKLLLKVCIFIFFYFYWNVLVLSFLHMAYKWQTKVMITENGKYLFQIIYILSFTAAWMFVFPPNSYVKILTPEGDCIKKWGVWGVIRSGRQSPPV